MLVSVNKNLTLTSHDEDKNLLQKKVELQKNMVLELLPKLNYWDLKRGKNHSIEILQGKI